MRVVVGNDCGSTFLPHVNVEDRRGFFLKGYLGDFSFRDIFVTRSVPLAIRGMHVLSGASTKVMTVLSGEINDLVLCKESNAQIALTQRRLTAGTSVLIPPGMAHGFEVLGSRDAWLLYACTESYDVKSDSGFSPLSAELLTFWTKSGETILSDRDLSLPTLEEFSANW